MRVTSPLADLDFEVGRIRRVGPDLRIESRPDASLPTAVSLERAEARALVLRLLTSPAVWAFGLSLLLPGGRAAAPVDDVWHQRRSATGLNKPW